MEPRHGELPRHEACTTTSYPEPTRQALRIVNRALPRACEPLQSPRSYSIIYLINVALSETVRILLRQDRNSHVSLPH